MRAAAGGNQAVLVRARSRRGSQHPRLCLAPVSRESAAHRATQMAGNAAAAPGPGLKPEGEPRMAWATRAFWIWDQLGEFTAASYNAGSATGGQPADIAAIDGRASDVRRLLRTVLRCLRDLPWGKTGANPGRTHAAAVRAALGEEEFASLLPEAVAGGAPADDRRRARAGGPEGHAENPAADERTQGQPPSSCHCSSAA